MFHHPEFGKYDPDSLKGYESIGGFRALRKALTMEGCDIADVLAANGVQGRGDLDTGEGVDRLTRLLRDRDLAGEGLKRPGLVEGSRQRDVAVEVRVSQRDLGGRSPATLRGVMVPPLTVPSVRPAPPSGAVTSS